MQPVAMATDRVHTISDIARLAGVSKSTVSRALNDSPLIGAETKQRIRTIAREHGFRMNAPARSLSRRRSNAIALVSYMWGDTPPELDVFMLEIMSGLSNGLHAQDYDLMVVHVHKTDLDWSTTYLQSGRVDGFVVLTPMCSPRQLEMLIDSEAPFIIWGRAPGEGERYCSVSGDNAAGGELATAHLLGLGRKRVAFLGGPEHSDEVRARYAGYEAAHADAGLAVDAALVAHAKWNEPETRAPAAIDELLGRAPDLDAVFANSDLFAIAAMDALRANGRQVPEDVAVVGYDDALVARHANPPLTTIRQSGELAGRLLAENLIQHLATGAITNVTIPAELVVRSSA
jgi:DNA-binding LacI/PurR family transcriptional regulator